MVLFGSAPSSRILISTESGRYQTILSMCE
jgi:hypothetical protein